MNIFGNESRDLLIDLNGKEIMIPSEIFDRINYLLDGRTTDNIYLLTNRILDIGFDGIIQSELFVDWRDTHNLNDAIVTNIVNKILNQKINESFEIVNVFKDDTLLPYYDYKGTLTFMKDLPLNQEFHARNGGWYGKIILLENKKHLIVSGIDVAQEITNDMYCWI